MIKYYVIDLKVGDVNKAVSSICDYQDVSTNDVVIIEGGLEQVFTIPQLQAHDGIAVVLLSSAYLKDKIDVETFVSDGCVMMRDPLDKVFVMDCNKPFYKSSIGPKTKLSNFLGFDIGSSSLWRIAIDLGKCVGCDLVLDEPVIEPDPQPDPQEVAKEWYPMDELPDNGE